MSTKISAIPTNNASLAGLHLPDIKAIHLTDVFSIKQGIKVTLFDITNVHPLASGNKFLKLFLNIEEAISRGCTRVLSFGGAFSNHIYALALYASDKNLKSIGIIRGESEYISNPTLSAAATAGMQLEFVDRKTYRLRHDADYLAELQLRYPDTYIIPEGGTNDLAVKSCAHLAKLINAQSVHPIDVLTVCCGTGGTLAGLCAGIETGQQLIGFPVLKDRSLAQRINELLDMPEPINANYKLVQADYGGYAKFDLALLDFILDWLGKTGILLDPIYTSKMCRRLLDLIEQGEFAEGSHIAIIHTGGLQAWYGMRSKVIKLKGEEAWQRIENACPEPTTHHR